MPGPGLAGIDSDGSGSIATGTNGDLPAIAWPACNTVNAKPIGIRIRIRHMIAIVNRLRRSTSRAHTAISTTVYRVWTYFVIFE